MNRIFTLILVFISLSAIGQQQTYAWLKNTAFGQSSAVIINRMVVSKTSNNIFIAGMTDLGDAQFPNGVLITDNGLPFRRDGFIAKLDQNANPIWVKEFDHADQYGIGDLALDNQDNLYLVARTEDSTSVDNISIPDDTYYWMKFDSSGTHLANAQFTATTHVQRAFVRLAVNNVGESYFSFLFNGNIVVGGNTYNSGTGASLVIKVDSIGGLQWSKQINTGYARDLDVNSSGNLLYCGQCGDNATFDSFTCVNSTGRSTPLVAELDKTNGNAVRIFNPSVQNGGEVKTIYVDNNDNYYFGGEFGRQYFASLNQMIFGNDTLSGLTNSSNSQLGEETGFIAKASSNGQALWLKQVGYRPSVNQPVIKLFGSGSDIYLLGEMRDSLNLESASGNLWLKSFNQSNNFIAKFDANGNAINARPSTLFNNEFRSIDCSNSGDVFVSGSFDQSFYYSLNDSLNFTGNSAAFDDSYVGKINSLDTFSISAPSNVKVHAKGSVNSFLFFTDLSWTDNSGLEQGFAIETTSSWGSKSSEIFNVPNDTIARAVESFQGNVLTFSVRAHLYDVVSNKSNEVTDTVGPGMTTSLVQNQLENSLNFYPNPTRGRLTVDGLVGVYRVKVINIMGQSVKNLIVDSYNNEINLTELPGGNYLLLFEDHNTTFTKRINLLTK